MADFAQTVALALQNCCTDRRYGERDDTRRRWQMRDSSAAGAIPLLAGTEGDHAAGREARGSLADAVVALDQPRRRHRYGEDMTASHDDLRQAPGQPGSISKTGRASVANPVYSPQQRPGYHLRPGERRFSSVHNLHTVPVLRPFCLYHDHMSLRYPHEADSYQRREILAGLINRKIMVNWLC